MHGGKSLSGPASPNWKHGGHSSWLKALPANLKEAALASIEQGARIEQDDSLALLDALMDETASQMDRGASDGLWRALGEHVAGARKLKKEAESLGAFAQRTQPGDAKDKAEEKAREALYAYEDAVDTIFTLVDEGAAYAGHRQELVRLVEQKRKHQETEIKRRTAAFSVMQASQVLALVQTVIETAIAHMPERSNKAAFVVEVRKLLPGLVEGADG